MSHHAENAVETIAPADRIAAAPSELSRRFFLLAAPAVLAGCVSSGGGGSSYGARRDGHVTLPAMDTGRIDPRFLRQEVAYATRERPGTIVVQPSQRYLYYVLGGGRAIRYGVGVGRQGALWHGRAAIGRKGSWPNWTPTANMIAHDPRNARYAGGMAGGINNPLGARALYLYRGNRDTMYRLHGTNEPLSIGHAVSSGCIRLFNHDIIDLYERARVGTPVVVLT
ncbi:L,D-transpeptidase [Phreatobacter sp. AB_2022a]|uniref:L,D-transpeptidase n=1 Tax=Phreatobacter sp. AB_2022a TaxID=3003134 RepID=UPI0022875C4F|nr:L,D-transpeptidase [Phreatobacter sp. AB_2022a]MCZ0733946.1 L,D-transpeptidase [Phreatobacter sp. AB_2022a]